MAYKIQHITHFDAKQMINYLEQSNDGKGTRTEIRDVLRIQDKIDDCGRNKINKAGNANEVFTHCLSKEEKEKKDLTQAELEELILKRQEEKWDEEFLAELILEDSEYDLLKKALDPESAQYVKHRPIARRMNGLFEKIEKAEKFDIQKASKKEKETVNA